VGHPVRPILGVPGAENGILVLVLRQLGKRVTDRNARNVRRNHTEFAANLLRCKRLGVEAIEMADPALQPKKDARDVFPWLCARASASLQEARQRQTYCSQRTDP